MNLPEESGRIPPLAGFSMTVPAEAINSLVETVSERVRMSIAAQDSEPWPEWMCVETAARYLDVPKERVRKLKARHEIPFHQEGPGCRVLFRRRDLDAWMGGFRHAEWA